MKRDKTPDIDAEIQRLLGQFAPLGMNPEQVDAIRAAALNTKVIYDAFTEAGFTPDQALVLTINVINANSDGSKT
ncbi:hypothetical protein DUY81_08485 [Acidipropionibacterium acidipropionici]|uniref:Uncharacterized protein n=1 Tax=Acidipropionibacterium acidipropionici TaxID=1748 RepID=A0AAC8YEL9_9ACTN|nr:hypothetical protein [Acidipropionibacterium acidipropionici]AMS04652.1 hypothetical protein AXH35_03300 [Acidipropionibacterium acidipropionici]AOZ46141.1 hypothetical protein A8L58_04765 [Acidipropionibacterium acidipropionici]AZP37830.1 hypothetical protein DUY81_08485 [Acidipropionibacterium acidipropionici]